MGRGGPPRRLEKRNISVNPHDKECRIRDIGCLHGIIFVYAKGINLWMDTNMSLTLTLICSLDNPVLTQELCVSVGNDLSATSIDWLYPNTACDFQLTSTMEKSEAIEIIGEKITQLPIDCVVQPTEKRRKKLFLADMDSTIIGQECIDELAAEIGIKEDVAKITEAAMNGEIEFEDALKNRVALLAELEESVVSKVLENRITVNKGAKEALATMRKNQTHTALVSGGFTVFASEIAKQVGFHEFHANVLLADSGKFTGKVAEPILGQQAKLDQLNRLATKQKLRLNETIAIGDGANDLPMLLNAGVGIAYHAKPTVAAQAGVVIRHGDLSSILFVQGYTKADIDLAMA